MKARDLVEMVSPDHQFTMFSQDGGLLTETAIVITLKCSCLWKTRRAVSPNEVDMGYSTTLTSEWSDREQIQHLLDQEIDVEDVLRAIEKGELT